MYGISKKSTTFAVRFTLLYSGKGSGCSAVRLAYLLWEQRVAGSNPATPTKKKLKFARQIWAFCIRKPPSLLERFSYAKSPIRPQGGWAFSSTTPPPGSRSNPALNNYQIVFLCKKALSYRRDNGFFLTTGNYFFRL